MGVWLKMEDEGWGIKDERKMAGSMDEGRIED